MSGRIQRGAGAVSTGVVAVTLSALTATTAVVRSQTPVATSSSLAITNVAVVDTVSGALQPDMTVVVTGERITDVGPAARLRVAEGVRQVDGRGRFLIPGLWDMHAHLYFAETLPLSVANGVTGARVMDGIPVLHRSRGEIAAGTLVGPRFVIGSRLIDGPKPVFAYAITVKDGTDARQAVLEAKRGGAEFIKVYEFLPRDAFFAIADESRKQGLPFAGHVTPSVSVEEASRAGQKSIEHDRFMLATTNRENELRKMVDDAYAKTPPGAGFPKFSDLRELVRLAADAFSRERAQALATLLKENGTWICPTMSMLDFIPDVDDSALESDARLKYLPSALRQQWLNALKQARTDLTPEDRQLVRRSYGHFVETVLLMHAGGVGLLAGIDGGMPFSFPAFGIHDELRALVDAGLTPLEALQTATLNPARFFDREKDLGTVAAGKLADLVLLDANPLAAITNTTRINAVVANGRLFRRADLDDLLAKAEAAANK
jgi:imidazolonepropionase-like amidohydrolase